MERCPGETPKQPSSMIFIQRCNCCIEWFTRRLSHRSEKSFRQNNWLSTKSTNRVINSEDKGNDIKLWVYVAVRGSNNSRHMKKKSKAVATQFELKIDRLISWVILPNRYYEQWLQQTFCSYQWLTHFWPNFPYLMVSPPAESNKIPNWLNLKTYVYQCNEVDCFNWHFCHCGKFSIHHR